MLHLALDNLLERIPLGGTIRGIVPRYLGNPCGNDCKKEPDSSVRTLEKGSFSFCVCISAFGKILCVLSASS